MKPSRTRAAIYIRVSSDMQVDGYSLETQEQECREYRAANDYEVVGVYREVYTGVVLNRGRNCGDFAKRSRLVCSRPWWFTSDRVQP
ncbi:MAG: recombinase family protein [Thermomicrobiales bacterium]